MSARPASPGVAPTVPGPIDREHFFAAQARNRRAAWRLTALAALGVALMGLPMSVVISPLVYAALLILNDLVSLVAPAADLLPLLAHLGPQSGSAPLPDAVIAVMLAAALVVPGSLVMLLAWLGTRALFLHGGSEMILRSLRTREPRPDDPEERQLRNLVEEMAIAAGVRPPTLVLLEGAAANAGAVGTGPDEATLIVSRRLLDELDREETQGIIGQLVASVGNGDLRAALAIVSMHRAFGLVMAVLGAPFGAQARATLLRLVRIGLRRGGAADAEELRAVDELLAQSASMDHHDVDPGKKTTIADVLRLPFLMASMAFWFARLAFVGFVVGPLLALLWRSRRYLADATAVQLTRNPDGVARGLAALASRGAAVPGGGWAAPLFLVGPASGPSGGFRGDDLGIVSYSPPAAKRLARLRRQGATVEMRAPGGLPGLARLCIGLFASIVGVALVSCALMLSYLALIIDMLILAPVVMAIHGLLRYWSPG